MAQTTALPGFLQSFSARWLLVAAAFLAGWLLFVPVWLVARRDDAPAPPRLLSLPRTT